MFADIYKKYIQPLRKKEEVPVRTTFLGIGESVSYNTLLEMKNIIKQSAHNNEVIKVARQIVQDVDAKDFYGEANAIYNFVRDNSRYVRDPLGLEHIQTPLVAISGWNNGEIFQGDCDDYTVLLLSLLMAIGFPVKLIAASYTPDKKLTHVYGAVNIRGIWVIVEGIRNGVNLGWQAPNPTRTVEVYV